MHAAGQLLLMAFELRLPGQLTHPFREYDSKIKGIKNMNIKY